MASEPGLPRTAADVSGKNASSLADSPDSCSICNKLHAVQRGQIVVGVVHHTVGQLRLLLRHLFVGNEAQKMANAVEARPPLVVGADNVPGCEICVGRCEHRVARSRIFEPSAARAQIRRAQLPLPQRILNASQEAALLLRVADLQPVFDQLNTAVDNEQLELRANLEEVAMLLVSAEAHDVLNARPVIPAAVEDHDLARRRKVRDVALQIQLSL